MKLICADRSGRQAPPKSAARCTLFTPVPEVIPDTSHLLLIENSRMRLHSRVSGWANMIASDNNPTNPFGKQDIP
jgi:hypothetical protein